MSGDLSTRPPDLRVRRNPTARGALRGWVLTGIAGLGFLIVALVVAAYFDAAFGVQASLLALAAAVVPLGIVIPTFLWLDRFESEPNRLLVGAFLLADDALHHRFHRRPLGLGNRIGEPVEVDEDAALSGKVGQGDRVPGSSGKGE